MRFSQLLSAPFLVALETQIFVNNLRNWWSIDPPASREISLTVWWLWGCLSDSATATQLCRRFHQCAHCVCRLSTVPNFTSSLWMLFFVQPLSKNSVISTERCNLYIHTDVWSKLCLFLLNGIKVVWRICLIQRQNSLFLFSMSDLKDENLIKKAIVLYCVL